MVPPLPALASVLIAMLAPLVVFGVALSTRLGDLRTEARNPVLWRTLVVALVGVPLLAILVAEALGLAPMGKGLLVLMAISPGAPLLLNKARTKGAVSDGPLAVALSLALSAGAVVLVPVGVALENALFGLTFEAHAGVVARSVIPNLCLPLLAGFAVRAAFPKAADRLGVAVRILSRAALLGTAVLVFVAAHHHLGKIAPRAWGAAVAIIAGTMLMGEFAARGRPADRTIVVDALVLSNPAIPLFVGKASYPGQDFAPYIFIYVLLRAVVLIVYERIRRRRLGPSPSAEAGAERGQRLDERVA
jgi:BASS family bile acid:Na+ symporter